MINAEKIREQLSTLKTESEKLQDALGNMILAIDELQEAMEDEKNSAA